MGRAFKNYCTSFCPIRLRSELTLNAVEGADFEPVQRGSQCRFLIDSSAQFALCDRGLQLVLAPSGGRAGKEMSREERISGQVRTNT